MSWAEVYKINSDLDEPLNFTNYIYDISVFGANSYVLQPMNVQIWNQLSQNSMYLYGHKVIHDVVYNALSTTNVDNLWNLSGKCGRQLNAFYNTSAFSIGNGLKVVQGMTVSAFNILEPKLRDGYSRYLNQFLNKTSGVGAWLNTTFNLNDSNLASLSTVTRVILNDSAMSTICKSEPAVVALTNCAYSANLIANSSSASQKFVTNCLTSLTIYALINNSTFISSAVNDQPTMHLIANNSTAMYDVIRSTIAMNPILNSSVAMTEMAASTTAVNTFVNAEHDLALGSTALANIQSALDIINNNLPNIIEGSSAQDEVAASKSSIITTTNTINPIISKIAVVQSFVNNFVNSSTAMTAIANNASAMSSIINSQYTMNAIASSTIALNAIFSSNLALSFVFPSALALNALLKSSYARDLMVTNSVLLQTYYDAIYNAVQNTTYFTKKYDYIDSGVKRAIATGLTDATNTPNQSLYLCKKIGSWSNGSNTTGYIFHLQNATAPQVTSHGGTLGGGYATDDFTTGGYQVKAICIGGCRFTESSDAYTGGYFCYAI